MALVDLHRCSKPETLLLTALRKLLLQVSAYTFQIEEFKGPCPPAVQDMVPGTGVYIHVVQQTSFQTTQITAFSTHFCFTVTIWN
mmetsp:Transcript_30057/g.54077  ORF Transcript_30057/g.54077 Transcript_30057/m.54077 type:complete len:85 (-) Transcript_30057:165-419(-)